jgi:MerR family transcriptional regulator, light-induced transcriptional regulator
MSETLLRIGEVARRADVPVELLRAWERRYGVVQPERTGGGFRLYTEDDIRRVIAMRTHIEHGLAASEAARLAIAEEAATNGSAPPVGLAARELQEALDHFDDVAAQAVLDRLLAAVSLDVALRDVVVPYLRGVGERWEEGELSIAQEHFASNVVRGRLMSLARGWDRGSGPRALLACAPGDQHDLPLLMLGLCLRSHGWRISYLGADTPLDSVLEAVDELVPSVTVISGTPDDAFAGREAALRDVSGRTTLALCGRAATSETAAAAGARLLDGDPVAVAEVLARGD